jgi:hypothetical protein
LKRKIMGEGRLAEEGYERHIIAGMTESEKKVAFLRELTRLSRKYMLAISGCGCCGSPALDAMTAKDAEGSYDPEGSEDVEWNAERAEKT